MSIPQARRPRLDRRGITLIEIMIAIFLMAFLVIVMGVIVLETNKSWRRGAEKLDLQEEATFAVEQIGRDVRMARTVTLDGTTELRCFDEAGTEYAVYTFASNQALRGGQPLVDEECAALVFELSPDGGTVRVQITLEDDSENQVLVESKTTLRNRNLSAL